MKSRLLELVRRLRGETGTRGAGPAADLELLEAPRAEQKRDVGVLRLTILQAALKEKRIVESKG